jgi:hypothetical protein
LIDLAQRWLSLGTRFGEVSVGVTALTVTSITVPAVSVVSNARESRTLR